MPDQEIFETANGFPSPSGLHRVDANVRQRAPGSPLPSSENQQLLTQLDNSIPGLTSGELREVCLPAASMNNPVKYLAHVQLLILISKNAANLQGNS